MRQPSPGIVQVIEIAMVLGVPVGLFLVLLPISSFDGGRLASPDLSSRDPAALHARALSGVRRGYTAPSQPQRATALGRSRGRIGASCARC